MAPVMEEKKKRRHLGGTSDGREEEAEMPNPHTSSNSNRARTDGIGDGKSQCCRTKNLMRPPLVSDFG